MKELNEQVRSSLLGGLIATVIYMVIATASDASKANVIGWGLGLGVFTMAVSFVISKVIGSRQRQ